MLDFSKNLSVYITDPEFKKDIVTYLSNMEGEDKSIQLAVSGIVHSGIPGRRLKVNIKPNIYTFSLQPNGNYIFVKDNKNKVKISFSIYNGYICNSYNYIYKNNIIVTSIDLIEDCKKFYNNRLDDIMSVLKDSINDEIDKLSNLKV